ncbi:hypothetical protein [Nocardioides sp. Kera G14]|uniref:hypothetical protein n=1 Tax=Nocardioides sp. Kera G14 TaxID=2884264 RepID=UPI001D125E20|nr:hypothetical protein [Nocardioides sp. Kera G14]UDY24642.1 hypothetical protein LH076_04875 [Nocardioides sp. Kera G14]
MPYRNRRRSSRAIPLGVAVVVCLLLIAVGWAIRPRGGEDVEGPASAADAPSAATPLFPGSDAEPQPIETATGTDGTEKASAQGKAPSWLTSAFQGSSATLGARRAVIRLTASDNGPMSVRYAFNTGDGYDSGSLQSTGSWSKAEQVQGVEPLVGVIGQVIRGTLTCTVTLDGKVISHQSRSGAWAVVQCFA